MRQEVLERCELFIRNRAAAKSVFRFDSGMMHTCCASIFTSKGIEADENKLRECKSLLKHSVGAFSNFRSYARDPIISMLACSGEPEQLLDDSLAVYRMLKEVFFTSSFLPLAAILIAGMTQPEEYAGITARTRALYTRIRKNHPLLTSSEDSALCALLALSERTDEELIDDMEECYGMLRSYYLSKNALQSLTHVLALFDEPAGEKCEKVLRMKDLFRTSGRRYGSYYELATLGVLAMENADQNALVAEVIETDDWLRSQKGFGFWSSVTKKQRLMYAGMLTGIDSRTDVGNTAAISGTVSALIAEQIALCCCICSCTAASAAAASSSSH